jgi:hypothetical protein
MVRLSLLPGVAALSLASALSLSTTACSSLTRPDEVTIVAEAPPPTIKQLPPMPQPGAAQPGTPRPLMQPVQPQPTRPAAGTACGE